MASLAPAFAFRARSTPALADPALAIGGPRVDAFLFWGAPLIAFLLVTLVAAGAATLPTAQGAGVVRGMIATVGVLTYAHLIAVVPRAYLNREVFAVHPWRLTLAPVLLVGALLSSPLLLAAGIVAAVLWDVHHSAMQSFGLGRIYDLKAGNDPRALRRIDLWLSWALYIGPLAAGAALAAHAESFRQFAGTPWGALSNASAWVGPHAASIRIAAMLAWAAMVALGALGYARASRRGYRLSAHKAALYLSTATVSIAAWLFSPPFVAFAAINLFHAAQYFAIVWLKEGGRIGGLARGRLRHAALPLFVAACLGFGLLYALAAATKTLLAPFVAVSLLHFWYDGFVWSVRRRQV